MKTAGAPRICDSSAWMFVMCGAFVANAVCTAMQRGLQSDLGLVAALIIRTVFITIWLVYTIDVCRTLDTSCGSIVDTHM